MNAYTLLFLLAFTNIEVDPVVMVVNENRAAHSGVIIKCDETIQILTCSHMLSEIGIKHCQVEFYLKSDKNKYISLPAKIVKHDHKLDIMLLEVKNSIDISANPVKIGDDYSDPHTLKGFAGFNNYKSFRLYKTSEANYGEAMQFRGTALSGMSGGPVLNSKGEVVAIQSTKGNGTTTGCSLKSIKKFIGD